MSKPSDKKRMSPPKKRSVKSDKPMGSSRQKKDLKSVSNSELVSKPKSSTVLREVKNRVKSGKIKLPKGFDTKKSSVSILMDTLNKKKK